MRISRIASLSSAPLKNGNGARQQQEPLSYELLYGPMRGEPQEPEEIVLCGPDDGKLTLFGVPSECSSASVRASL